MTNNKTNCDPGWPTADPKHLRSNVNFLTLQLVDDTTSTTQLLNDSKLFSQGTFSYTGSGTGCTMSLRSWTDNVKRNWVYEEQAEHQNPYINLAFARVVTSTSWCGAPSRQHGAAVVSSRGCWTVSLQDIGGRGGALWRILGKIVGACVCVCPFLCLRLPKSAPPCVAFPRQLFSTCKSPSVSLLHCFDSCNKVVAFCVVFVVFRCCCSFCFHLFFVSVCPFCVVFFCVPFLHWCSLTFLGSLCSIFVVFHVLAFLQETTRMDGPFRNWRIGDKSTCAVKLVKDRRTDSTGCGSNNTSTNPHPLPRPLKKMLMMLCLLVGTSTISSLPSCSWSTATGQLLWSWPEPHGPFLILSLTSSLRLFILGWIPEYCVVLCLHLPLRSMLWLSDCCIGVWLQNPAHCHAHHTHLFVSPPSSWQEFFIQWNSNHRRLWGRPCLYAALVVHDHCSAGGLQISCPIWVFVALKVGIVTCQLETPHKHGRDQFASISPHLCNACVQC